MTGPHRDYHIIMRVVIFRRATMSNGAFPTMVDERAICGARNNADLYESVFSVHGLEYHRSAYSFVADDVPPPYYSALTVLSPNDAAIMSELANLARRLGGVMGIKDSFCRLDLASNGFETLFEASWIWRSPRQVTIPAGWEVVKEASDLLLWEDGWKRNGSPTDKRMFPDAFLARDDVVFLGRKIEGRFVAGCIANRSDDCVGLSNVFAETSSQIVFSQASDAAAAVGGNVPVVAYESGAKLEYANQADFDTVGQLRVLVTRNAEF